MIFTYRRPAGRLYKTPITFIYSQSHFLPRFGTIRAFVLVNMKTTKVKSLPVGYGSLLEDLKERIRTAQVKASLSANRELIVLYWDIGKSIVERQRDEGWGKTIVERLSTDLQREFPGIAGFSPQNIWKMRAFYLAWTADVQVLSQPVRELDGSTLPSVAAEIPWGHNTELVFKVKDPVVRLWYIKETIFNGWSRASLTHWIESGLHTRQGKAVSNFKMTLPPSQSNLATELIRDPYHFDFLTLHTRASERELEQGLLNHIRKFLLELGAGFAFVGQQVHLEVDRQDYYLDLLFYHLHLRCYIVVDLKVRPFKPEHAGKMNFYLSAVDDILRHPDDKPSIGIILCQTHSRVIAEYALRHVARPVGIARYITKLVDSLPKELKSQLPSVEQIQDKIADVVKTQSSVRHKKKLNKRTNLK